MKISEMTNDQAAEVLVKIAAPISNILDDDNVRPLIDEMENSDRSNPTKFLAAIVPKVVAFCMKDHKGDLYEIVGALTFKPASKVGNMNFMTTVKEIRESIDEDLIGFFRSSGNATTAPGQE